MKTTVEVKGTGAHNKLTVADLLKFVSQCERYSFDKTTPIQISLGSHNQRDPYPDTLKATQEIEA